MTDLAAMTTEGLCQHAAKLRSEYIADAAAWIEHQNNAQVDAKFDRYQAAIRTIKERTGWSALRVQDELDKVSLPV